MNILYKNNEICLKINEKLNNFKVEEYQEYNEKNKNLYEQKTHIQNDIELLENELNGYKGKYRNNAENIKNTEYILNIINKRNSII